MSMPHRTKIAQVRRYLSNKQQTSNNLTISTAIFCDIQPCYNKLLSQDQTYT